MTECTHGPARGARRARPRAARVVAEDACTDEIFAVCRCIEGGKGSREAGHHAALGHHEAVQVRVNCHGSQVAGGGVRYFGKAAGGRGVSFAQVDVDLLHIPHAVRVESQGLRRWVVVVLRKDPSGIMLCWLLDHLLDSREKFRGGNQRIARGRVRQHPNGRPTLRGCGADRTFPTGKTVADAVKPQTAAFALGFGVCAATTAGLGGLFGSQRALWAVPARRTAFAASAKLWSASTRSHVHVGNLRSSTEWQRRWCGRWRRGGGPWV